MLAVSARATEVLGDVLTSRDGVGAHLNALRQAGLSELSSDIPISVSKGNYSIALSDRTKGMKYPQIVVYCVRVENSLRQKFQQFSGKVDMVVEIRHSADRLDRLEAETQACVEAVLRVLDQSRGELSEGLYYSGRYDVRFEPIGKGGKNFAQTAKVGLSLEANVA
ncbi:MAG: hypothetical protein JNN08_11155 [Bryobacterales bacterium]|nr:hypothetical protein [Bryobacterales bacterium]